MTPHTHPLPTLLLSIITLLMLPATACAALPSWSFDPGTGVLSAWSSAELNVSPQVWNGGIDLGCYGCEGLITGVAIDDVSVIDISSTKALSISPSSMSTLHNIHGDIAVRPHSDTAINIHEADAHPGNTSGFPTNVTIIGKLFTAHTPTGNYQLQLDAPRISKLTVHGTKYDDVIDLSRSTIPITTANKLNIQANLGSGDDTLLGPPRLGSSEIYLGDGDDTIRMPTGDNRVFAGGGNDTITTGTGRDSITANAGNDTIRTGPGNDAITDLTGYTTHINSGTGNDSMSVFTTTSTIHTGPGRDSVSVFARRVRRATVYLGSNNDQIVFRQNIPHLTLDCGRGTDLTLFHRPEFRHCERSQVP